MVSAFRRRRISVTLCGGFMCPKYVEENGKVFYFAMSQFFPIYNIMWMRVELP